MSTSDPTVTRRQLIVAVTAPFLLVLPVLAPGAVPNAAAYEQHGPTATDGPSHIDGVPIGSHEPVAVIRYAEGAVPSAFADASDYFQDETDGFALADQISEVASAGHDHLALHGVTANEVNEVLDAGDPVVEEAAPAQPAELAAADVSVEHQWHLDNTGQEPPEGSVGTEGADVGWGDVMDAGAAQGAGITVAVVDSGIDTTHPDLSGQIWSNTVETSDGDCFDGDDPDSNGYPGDCSGWDFVDDDNSVGPDQPDDHHGTQVASIIAGAVGGGKIAGIAPEATVMPLQVVSETVDGAPSGFWMHRAAEAVTYAVDNGADIINLSLASAPGASPDLALEHALEHAGDHGVLVVTAAGNDNADLAAQPVWPASHAATLEHVVAVGATDNHDEPASFSNHGDDVVQLAAPGAHVLAAASSTDIAAENAYSYLHGTSASAAVVSGVAAAVLEQAPSESPGGMRSLLARTSEPRLALLDRVGAAGRVSLRRALGIPAQDASWRVSATGLSGLEPTDSIDTTLSVAHSEVDQAALRLTLVTAAGDEIAAVTERELAIMVDGAASDTETTADGEIPHPALDSVSLADDGTQISLATDGLPEGRYAITLDLPEASSQDGTALLFTVGSPPLAPPISEPEKQGESGDGGSDGPGDGADDPNDGTTDPDSGGDDPDDGTTDPDDSTTDPDDSTNDPDSGGDDPDDSTTDPYSGGDPDDGTTDPDSGTTDPDSGGDDPNDGTTDPDSGGDDPDAGTDDPGDEQAGETEDETPCVEEHPVCPVSMATDEDGTIRIAGDFLRDDGTPMRSNNLTVHFGPITAPVDSATSQWLYVENPQPASPMSDLDVEVYRTWTGMVERHESAFAFTEATDGPGGSGGDGSSDDSGSGDGTDDSGGSDDGADDGTTDDGSTDDGSGTDDSDAGDDPDASDGGDAAGLTEGSPRSYAGLRVDAITEAHPASGLSSKSWTTTSVCASSPCTPS